MTERDFSKGSFSDHAEMLLNKMIDEIQDYSIILLDRDGHVMSWNRGAQAIKGYDESEVVGKHFRIFYSPEDQADGLPDKLLSEAANRGKAVYEGWRLRKDGSQFWGSIVLTALHDEGGDVMGFSKLTRDLTERKLAEDIMRAKNADLEQLNQELASFAYVASHDLQEPLRKIQTFLSRIEEMEKDKLSGTSLDYFRRVQSASRRMQTLIQDLLAYSRTSTDQRVVEQVDLNEVVDTVKKDLTEALREKNGTIKSDRLPVVRGVKFQLAQLFTNLVGNSIKFSKEAEPPVISISCERVHGSRANGKKSLDPESDYFHIRVADNGIGFEPEFNAKIFELFQRLHGRAEYSGSGIGLAICKKIVENHQGIILAEGQKGHGSTFHIYLPDRPKAQ